MNATKRCQICKLDLSITLFGKARNRSDGLFPECKECANKTSKIRARIKKTAPPKPTHCECCGIEPNAFVMDHCHETETFRGWLCRNCNMGIGKLGDNIEGLQTALRYLSTKVQTT